MAFIALPSIEYDYKDFDKDLSIYVVYRDSRRVENLPPGSPKVWENIFTVSYSYYDDIGYKEIIFKEFINTDFDTIRKETKEYADKLANAFNTSLGTNFVTYSHSVWNTWDFEKQHESEERCREKYKKWEEKKKEVEKLFSCLLQIKEKKEDNQGEPK